MASSGRRVLGPLGWRLFAAFILVGVGAVALLALLAGFSISSQTSGLLATERDQARHDIVTALTAAYSRAGSWQNIDLVGVQALAQNSGARLIILDTTGGQIATVTPSPESTTSHPSEPEPPGERHDQTTPPQSRQHGHGEGLAPADTAPGAPAARPAAQVVTTTTAAPSTTSPPPTGSASDRVPVVVDGRTVGAVLISFPDASQTSAGQAGQAILHRVALGTLLAVLLAAVVALVVSRRTTRPLVALAAATEAVERGEPDAAELVPGGPGEIGRLSTAFARMARALRREDELRRGMVADIAHELRTPVTILRGATEELLDGIANPTPDRLTSLHDEVLRLGRLVDDLAILAAAQAATLTLHPAPVDLATVAARAVDALRPLFEEADIETQLEIAPAPADGDQERLTQVVTNLLTNAIKFTPPGGRVTVATGTVAAAPGGSREARLTVTDTGPGIPAEEIPHLFQRFWRGSAATGRAGAGIGLAVVAELTAAHGGTITADSPAGAGATFTLTLPARQS